jgi:hypothetical protein
MLKRSKFGSKKTEVDGIMFDSKREANFYGTLKLQKAGNEIIGFEMQVPYELIPKFKIDKKTYRPTRYIADFVVTYLDGSVQVIDVKGFRDQVYKLKLKMMAHVHGIQVVEV